MTRKDFKEQTIRQAITDVRRQQYPGPALDIYSLITVKGLTGNDRLFCEAEGCLRAATRAVYYDDLRQVCCDSKDCLGHLMIEVLKEMLQRRTAVTAVV